MAITYESCPLKYSASSTRASPLYMVMNLANALVGVGFEIVATGWWNAECAGNEGTQELTDGVNPPTYVLRAPTDWILPNGAKYVVIEAVDLDDYYVGIGMFTSGTIPTTWPDAGAPLTTPSLTKIEAFAWSYLENRNYGIFTGIEPVSGIKGAYLILDLTTGMTGGVLFDARPWGVMHLYVLNQPKPATLAIGVDVLVENAIGGPYVLDFVPGTYTVTALSGPQTLTADITVVKNQLVAHTFTFEQVGTVPVTSNPTGATITWVKL